MRDCSGAKRVRKAFFIAMILGIAGLIVHRARLISPSSPEQVHSPTSEQNHTIRKIVDPPKPVAVTEATSPAPAATEAKHFRGLRDLSDRTAKYIELNFESDKWILSDGVSS
jgi:hypothetical protein